MLTITKNIYNTLLLWQNLTLFVAEPSVTHAQASHSVLDFRYYSLITTQINIELNIETN